LQFEDVVEATVETVGPDVRAGCRVDQLASNAHPVSALAHRTFEDIADTQFAADLFYVETLVLVCEGRIAGDDK
jgi:hypothetical protein